MNIVNNKMKNYSDNISKLFWYKFKVLQLMYKDHYYSSNCSHDEIYNK